MPIKTTEEKQGIINNGKSFIKCENECKTCKELTHLENLHKK